MLRFDSKPTGKSEMLDPIRGPPDDDGNFFQLVRIIDLGVDD